MSDSHVNEPSWKQILSSRGWQTFSIESDSKYFRHVGHSVSGATAQSCCCSAKVALGHM